ncbi:hypothetical protein EXIGLDRAFT_730268 [Exidia glandulosa HHB12029]|uniref:Uncharacterized protein n=1 Tax=Exidia glandulosa HHB12029 TaxID=1314781 RepID=A0A166B3J6_EXIGL|nr:hypothetical protein EXIGLDRAFT_730268 [Exidia glandulosa HHB12029]
MTSVPVPDTVRTSDAVTGRLSGIPDVEQRIARAFEGTVEELQPTALGGLERTQTVVALKPEDILALRMGERNATSSFQGRLPDELWSAIWEDDALTLSDCIRISHVCYSWRYLALLSPRLWRDVSFTTRRETTPKCSGSCQPCLNVEASLIDRRFARLETLLPRSRGLPLDLRVMCPYNDRAISTDFIARLAHALRPHSHRLAKIEARFDDKEKLCSFIRLLDDMPALRCLSVNTAHDTSVTFDEREFVPVSRQRMPVLEHLHLTHPAFDYALESTEPMVSVTTVTYAFEFEYELLNLFRAFPRLESVTLTPSNCNFFAWGQDPAMTAELRKLAEKVEDATFLGIASSEDWHRVLFELLHRRDMEAFTVRFTDTPPLRGSLASLSDMNDLNGVELEAIYIDASKVSITARARKRRRSFTFYYHRLDAFYTARADDLRALLGPIWEYLPLSSVDTLVVDAETWAALPPSPSHSSLARTTELRIVLRCSERYPWNPFPWTEPHPVQFPALRRVTLSSSKPWRCEVATGSLLQFVMSLGVTSKSLESVLRDGVSLVGPEGELRAMCRVALM